MNPLIVIPTYWQKRHARGEVNTSRRYDHASNIGTAGTLHRCLKSLNNVNGVGRIVLLVAGEEGAERAAVPWVRTITADFPGLRIVTVGPDDSVSFTVEAAGVGLTYQWQKRSSSSASWEVTA